FSKDGTMTVSKIAPKIHVGKNPIYLNLFKKDEEAVYTFIYRDGKNGPVLAKRFRIGGITRDKAYNLTKGTAGTMVLFFARHDTEADSDAQNLLVHLKPALYLRTLSLKFPVAALAIKGRDSLGNIVTKHAVDRVVNERKTAAGESAS
ncbi:MAG TPA: DNA topoisomerase, partial [Prosthecobacter sp.]